MRQEGLCPREVCTLQLNQSLVHSSSQYLQMSKASPRCVNVESLRSDNIRFYFEVRKLKHPWTHNDRARSR
eukprot:2540550-Amphidinium_carterae.1